MLQSPRINGQAGPAAPRRKPIWPWVLGCGAALVLFCWLAYLGGVQLWQRVLQPVASDMREIQGVLAETNKPAPPAGARSGTPLKWRVLHTGGWLNTFVGAATCGQFDQDPDLELLVANHDAQALLFQPDGSVSTCGLKLYGFGLRIEPWDYDGDGTDEVIANSSLADYYGKGFSWESPRIKDGNPSLLTPVFNLDGQIVAKLDGWPVNSEQLTGKFTADGPRQLVLMLDVAERQRKCLIYLPSGAKAGSYLPASGFMPQNHILDINSDGLDEILVCDISYPDPERWSAFRLDLPLKPVPGLDDKELLHVFDANGDGHQDVLTANDEYVDPRTWKAVKLQYPAGTAPVDKYYVCSATGGRFLPQQWVIAEATGVDVNTTGLMLFAPDGKCLLYEEMGEQIQCLTCWTFGGQDHLVACTEKRVLVSP
jgi:hypothetical protein